MPSRVGKLLAIHEMNSKSTANHTSRGKTSIVTPFGTSHDEFCATHETPNGFILSITCTTIEYLRILNVWPGPRIERIHKFQLLRPLTTHA